MYPSVTKAALAIACEAVGEEIKIKIAIDRSFKKTHIVVTCNIIPKIKNSTPPVSLIDAPWSLTKNQATVLSPNFQLEEGTILRR